MIILIPLGGLGCRFKKLGYKKPKPLINVMGKPIIFWLIDNLKFDNIDLIVIPYNNELEKYNFEAMLNKKYPNLKSKFKFLNLTTQTQGAAETVVKAIDIIDKPDCPIICMDGDNFYTYDIITDWNGGNNVFYIEDDSESSAFSFLDLKSNKEIVDIAEKNRISSNASTGAYGFSSFTTLKKYCNEIISKNIRQQNEFYLSNVIKLMIQNNNTFIGKCVNKNNFVCLGTPFDVRLFCNNYPRISAFDGINVIEPQRYCFDLDNTLVTYPKITGDYETVEPIQHTIDFLKYLKKIGHTIIIYTARRMNTHKGNVGKVVANVGKITLDTLEKFDIPYDEIHFGKPYADYYIDDLAISPFDDLEKELGYYKSTIDTRSFNNISSGISFNNISGIIHTYKKYGTDLSGEIYWYEHMPNQIKDMFPLFFGSQESYYTMERINGIPFSRLMLSEDLTIEHLKHIMNSIGRIHATTIPIDSSTKNISIYDNYCMKMFDRYQNYDYSKFKNADQIYQLIYAKLKEYEENNFGQLAVIHGDTVLTNIMINQFGKIKFIDMRGKIGEILTIVGDTNYDWAKLYQSLVGYDEILDDKHISVIYKNTLVKYFEDRFVKEFGEKQLAYLKYITSSLFFTLIPLHDNHKCQNYYNLIFKLINVV
jgi:capsule biosynthesis phosphatase